MGPLYNWGNKKVLSIINSPFENLIATLGYWEYSDFTGTWHYKLKYPRLWLKCIWTQCILGDKMKT